MNTSQSSKRHFCETINQQDVVISFFKWVVNDVLKPTNSRRDQMNDYVFVDPQWLCISFTICVRKFFGSRNVNVLIHNNRMIELKIQVNTGFHMVMVSFKDSYKFINLPLHSLPKLFGFQNELQKGFFPHNFNTKENMYYRGSLPGIEWFGVDNMNEDEKKRFMNWHSAEEGRLRKAGLKYDLRGEMVKYCYDDFFVLASAFSQFNQSMICELKSSGVDDIIDHDFTILADFITLPQQVIHWFIGCMMPQRTIAIVPNSAYDSAKSSSLKESVWLTYINKVNEHEEGVEFVPIMSRYCLGRGQHRVRDFFGRLSGNVKWSERVL